MGRKTAVLVVLAGDITLADARTLVARYSAISAAGLRPSTPEASVRPASTASTR